MGRIQETGHAQNDASLIVSFSTQQLGTETEGASRPVTAPTIYFSIDYSNASETSILSISSVSVAERLYNLIGHCTKITSLLQTFYATISF